MRFDNEERHQEKKLYANSKNFYDPNGGSAGKLVSVYYPKYGLLYFTITLQWDMMRCDNNQMNGNEIENVFLHCFDSYAIRSHLILNALLPDGENLVQMKNYQINS